MSASPLTLYLRSLQEAFSTCAAREHSYRPALVEFLRSFGSDIQPLNDPKRKGCGAPDIHIIRGRGETRNVTGYIETKNIDSSLEDIEKTPQIQRYLGSLDNFILTNYLDFKWFVNGQVKEYGSLGIVDNDTIRQSSNANVKNTLEIITQFCSQTPEPITNAKNLAVRMARISRQVKFMLSELIRKNEASPQVKQLFDTFGNLIDQHMERDQFADMFAQTLAYGLFVAASRQFDGNFRLENAARDIPPTNPFLRQLFHFISGPDLDGEPYALEVQELAGLMANADMTEVLRDFGERTRGQDPLVHFYETFLKSYDPSERERRGVYFTPSSVVSYIVRAVDDVLQTRFDCRDGIADKSKITKDKKVYHKVLILDPACGTGSFIYAIIDFIRNHFAGQGNAGEWRDYVNKHLLPRIFGFEVLMAPYAVAHLKINLELEARDMPETGRQIWACDLGKSDRIRIFLTNTLDDSLDKVTSSLGTGFLVDEVNAASEVKRFQPIMVVIGNPPYSGHSANKGGRITKLVEHYKFVDGQPLGEKNPKWLQDDYVKFIRYGQQRIEQTGSGILAFVTNHAYLDNPTFRGMRQRLMQTFDEIYLLNLHGNAKKREKTPEGGKDENVFDIQQGVAIGIFVKLPSDCNSDAGRNPDKQKLQYPKSRQSGVAYATVYYADLYGQRSLKDEWLASNSIASTNWQTLAPSTPFYLFIPQDTTLRAEYEKGLKINDIFPVNSVGIVTARDDLTIAFTREELIERITEFLSLEPEQAREKFKLGKDSSDWKIDEAQKDLKNLKKWEDNIVPILYRPFDVRWTIYTGNASGFHCRPRPEVMRHMLGGRNLGLCFHRREELYIPYSHFLVTDCITEHGLMSSKTTNCHAPLKLKEDKYNVNSIIFAKLKRDYSFIDSPEKFFNYIYAILYSPTYRSRYLEFLRLDFPRIPLTSDADQFSRLAELGQQLIDCHLLRFTLDDSFSLLPYPVPGNNAVEKGCPRYLAAGEREPETGRPLAKGQVYINLTGGRGGKGQYFEGVQYDIWNFHIGGYQVCDKWLKERRNRVLSEDERIHFRKIVTAIEKTISLTKEIDEAIPHWPLL